LFLSGVEVMTRHPLIICAALALLPVLTRGNDDRAESRARSGPAIAAVAELAQAGESAPQTEDEPASPPTAQPEETPPPAPSKVPPPPSEPRPSVPEGQWVYTAQYGWIWMPYADDYTYVPPYGYGAPYMYVYYPFYGWAWVDAPWVWGWGPWPYFGLYGSLRFAWYGHGWWRHPGRWHYWPGPHRGIWPSRGVRPVLRPHHGILPGVRPAPRPYHGSFPSRGIGPAPHRSGGVAHRPQAGRPRPR
jgi:hypothetical protein